MGIILLLQLELHCRLSRQTKLSVDHDEPHSLPPLPLGMPEELQSEWGVWTERNVLCRVCSLAWNSGGGGGGSTLAIALKASSR